MIPPKRSCSRESQDDRDDAGAGEQGPQLPFGVIDDAQDEQDRDQVNEKADHLAQEMRDRRLAFLLEVGVPQVAIEQGDDESGAQAKWRLRRHGCAIRPVKP